MQAAKFHKKITANTLVEYALLIGIITLVFIGMNTYIKRGLQGRIASLTDGLIGKGQAIDMNPTAETNSDSTSAYTSNAVIDMRTGGGMRLALNDRIDTVVSATVKDEPKNSNSGTYVPAEAGYVKLPDGNTEADAEINDVVNAQKTKSALFMLEREKEMYLTEAETAERTANVLEERGNELLQRVGGMLGRESLIAYVTLRTMIDGHADNGFPVIFSEPSDDFKQLWKLAGPGKGCQVSACLEAAVKLYRSGNELLKNAAEQREKAAALRQEAQSLDDKIAGLNKG